MSRTSRRRSLASPLVAARTMSPTRRFTRPNVSHYLTTDTWQVRQSRTGVRSNPRLYK